MSLFADVAVIFNKKLSVEEIRFCLIKKKFNIIKFKT
jgi:hypothetical protein